MNSIVVSEMLVMDMLTDNAEIVRINVALSNSMDINVKIDQQGYAIDADEERCGYIQTKFLSISWILYSSLKSLIRQ